MNAHYETTKENKATCEKQSNSCIDISKTKSHIVSSDTATLGTASHNLITKDLMMQTS